MNRLLLLCTVVIATTSPTLAQYWEITAGPPAATTSLATNSQGHVFAGTSSSAVYRTTNLGLDWERLDNGIDDGGPNFVTISQMVVGVNDELFAAVNGKGIFRSRDNGTTWQLLNLGVTVPSNARMTVARKVVENVTMVFVGMDAGASNLKCFLSENSGETFVDLPITGLPSAVSSVFEVFISPNSEKFFVLVSYNKGLYRSTNRGQSWTRIDSDPQSGESEDNFKTMTYDVNGHLYVGRNALPSSTHSKNAVVMKSTNDGTSWFYLTEGWNNNDITNNRISGIAISENGEMYASTEKSGTFYSTDFGATWVTRNDGLAGDGSATSVVITNKRHAFIAPIGAFIHRHIDPSTSVDEERSPLFAVGAPSPNPSVDVVRLPVTVMTSTPVVARVVDATGADATAPVEQMLDRGDHWIAFTTAGLAPGVYHLRVMAGQQMRTTSFVVAR